MNYGLFYMFSTQRLCPYDIKWCIQKRRIYCKQSISAVVIQITWRKIPLTDDLFSDERPTLIISDNYIDFKNDLYIIKINIYIFNITVVILFVNLYLCEIFL